MSEKYTQEELEDIKAKLDRIKELSDLRKSNVIKLADYKKKKEAKKETPKKNYINVDNYPKIKGNTELEDKHRRLSSSMKQLNTLMSELRARSLKENEEDTEKGERTAINSKKKPNPNAGKIAQLQKMKEDLEMIDDYISNIKKKG